MTEREWLDQLKVGEAVYVTQSYGQPPVKDVVARLTRTQIILTDGRKFNKATGRQITSNVWHREYLIQPSAEIEAHIVNKNLKKRAIRLRDKLAIPTDTPTLRKLIAALEGFVREDAE